ncbi:MULTISPECIES: magnesium chelatase subunit D [unclassified Sphingomonas]|uniref:magnesium chelatase subunit D n=1 Tax=unclassified Sphingomonas TaxID=196159 RepID=UPI0035A954F4
MPPPMQSDIWSDALLAARLCAIDPSLGGLVLRGGGEARDAVIAALVEGLGAGVPVRRVPSHIDDERLLGGLDLGATLSTGRAVSRVGLLAEADGGVVIVPMAERMASSTASPIAAALDTGEVIAEREGMALRSPARITVVLLDDGVELDERPPVALAERLAFWFDFGDVRTALGADPDNAGSAPTPIGSDVTAAPSSDILEAIAATTLALGIDSARAPIFALRAARAAAILAGRSVITEDDVMIAARLVLGPRATRMPAPPEAEPEGEAPEPPPPPPPESETSEQESGDPQPLEDVVLEAVLASLPKDVLAQIAAGGQRRGPQGRGQGKGAKQKSATRGRPVGVRAGIPRGGLRLSLIDTLRSAAPWQRVRGAEAGRVNIRRDDLRIRRFEKKMEATTIFAVDASGSSALARLAEAKGAVELLLAEAYVKRAQVALVAFRGTVAELILPPTRSLARARKSLGALPGGGGTPLASGLNAARELAEAARKRGRTPFLVILTDGRANICAKGTMVRQAAEDDAEAAAKAIGLSGIGSAFVDISPRPRPEGAKLAAIMGARYLPLPRADARAMHAAVKGAQHAD